MNEGRKFADKVKIFIAEFLWFMTFPLNKIYYTFKRDFLFMPNVFFFWDMECENVDGIFFCRRFTNDYNMVKSSFENTMKKQFDKEPDGLFLDVGSNIGKYTVMMARRGFNVLAFEPDNENLKVLRKNIILNRINKNVSIISKAAWSSNTVLRIYKNRGMGEQTQVGRLETKIMSPTSTDYISAVKIDDIVRGRKVSLAKLDIEGSEIDAFKGMKDTFRNNPNMKVIFEAWNFGNHVEDSKKILTSYGFQMRDISEGSKDGSQNNYMGVKK